MSERIYIVLDKRDGSEELVEGASRNGAVGLLSRDNYEARPAKPADVARLMTAGKTIIRAEKGEPE